MRQLFKCCLLVALLSGCKKNDREDLSGSSVGQGPAPIAAFRIRELVNNSIYELRRVAIENHSVDAVSYQWNFGNGTFSTEKNPSISFPFHGDYQITLTVKGRNGKTDELSQILTVLCVRPLTPHGP